jgi:hypothetical protein
MRQQPNPNPYEDEDELGTPVYQGSGLSVRALTAEEVQRFLDAHTARPAQLLGGGRDALDPSERTLGVPWAPPGAQRDPLEPQPWVQAEPVAGSLGRPGRSALAVYRQRHATELASWKRSLTWRVPLVVGAGLAAQVLAAQADLTWARLAGLAVAVLVGLAAAVPSHPEGPCLAARRRRGAANRQATRPAHPRRLRGLPRPGHARLARKC